MQLLQAGLSHLVHGDGLWVPLVAAVQDCGITPARGGNSHWQLSSVRAALLCFEACGMFCLPCWLSGGWLAWVPLRKPSILSELALAWW